MILLYEISANGKPKSYKAEPTDTFNWPRMLHLTWAEYDASGNLTRQEDRLIKPNGYDVSPEVEKYHQISLADLQEKGQDINMVLNDFKDAIDRNKMIFCFNQALSESVLLSEFHRQGIQHRLELTERFCLMRETTYFCKIPGKQGGYKWPTLQELHQSVFGASFKGANNAKTDLIALTKCFNHLWSNGHLDDLV